MSIGTDRVQHFPRLTTATTFEERCRQKGIQIIELLEPGPPLDPEKAQRESRQQSVRSWWAEHSRFQDYEPPSWIVDGLIFKGGITMWQGWRGCGKSYVAQGASEASVRGKRFGGAKTQRSRVIYLNRDNPPSIFLSRLDRFYLNKKHPLFASWSYWQGGGPPKLSIPKDDGNNKYRLMQDDFEIFDPGGYETLVKEYGARLLLIFDSLQRFHTADEDKNSQMAPVMEKFRALTVHGASILILHNFGKDYQRGGRGASAIEDGADHIVTFEKTGKDFAEPVKLTITKGRSEGGEGRPMFLDIDLNIGFFPMFNLSHPDDEQLIEAANAKLREKVLGRLSPDRGITISALRKQAGVNSKQFYPLFNNLKQEGAIRTERRTNKRGGGTLCFLGEPKD